MIRKITRGKKKGYWGIYHCHGKNKGKLIRAYPTKQKALQVHRAIILSEIRRGKLKSRRRL